VTREQDQAEELRKQFPLWEIWYVPIALGGITWCANPWSKKDDRRNVLHAETAEHLAEYIREREADIADQALNEAASRDLTDGA
jgi:hypothetical protein